MSYQSPMISIPRKTTEDVDWTTPIQNLIAQSFGERPDNYQQECQNLQRCRQDAVKGAGSDSTARDLLYKYFGQLELLELRFSEIKVQFPWRDAFTNKLTVQTSLAFEKASIIFLLASTHSALGATQNRSDPEALKRAVYYFKSAAGMLNYINENFLHAPSTDLSKEVVQFLVKIMLVQATEAVFEKCIQEKKLGNALLAKIAAQGASMYVGLSEEVKEFFGKGVFDRNWVTLIQIKAKYFTSLMHYYRGLGDDAAGKHGEALVRFTIAETNAKESNRLASTLISYFVTSLSPQLPADAGTSITEITKAHLGICSEKKKDAHRDNDMIYNAVLPPESTLSVIEKTIVAQPITIQEVFGTPAAQKTIGPDIFQKLIPLSVHEGASVYSEEKAKLVRAEVEKSENADGDVKAGLDSLGVKEGLGRFREMINTDESDVDQIPPTVRTWREEIAGIGEIEQQLREIEKLRSRIRGELESAGGAMEVESRACEAMRIRYEHLWTQEPSAGPSRNLRNDLKSHLSALDQAQGSDTQVVNLWNESRGDITILTDLNGSLEACFRDESEQRQDLLDLDVSADDEERKRIASLVQEIDEGIGRINKLGRERNETLKDLKEKIQGDDVSHILLLHRRGSSFEPNVFAQELEKFKPFQQRVAQSIQLQQAVLQEVATKWKTLKNSASRGSGARKWEEKERRKMEVVRRFARARDNWREITEGLAKGLQFYQDLSHGSSELHNSIMNFVKERDRERDEMVAEAEVKKRLASAPSSSPPPPPRPPIPQKSTQGLENAMGSMSLGNSSVSDPYSSWSPPIKTPSHPPAPPQQSYGQSPGPYSHPTPSHKPSIPPPPPAPPSAPTVDPYANMFGSGIGLSSQFSLDSKPSQSQNYTSLPPPPASQTYYGNTPPVPPAQGYGYPNPTPPQPRGFPPPPPQIQQHQYPSQGQNQNHSGFPPPPPPPINYQSQQPYSQPGGYQFPPPPGANTQNLNYYPYQQQQSQPPQGYGAYR